MGSAERDTASLAMIEFILELEWRGARLLSERGGEGEYLRATRTVTILHIYIYIFNKRERERRKVQNKIIFGYQLGKKIFTRLDLSYRAPPRTKWRC